MGCIALHGFDEVGHEVLPLLELHVHVAERLLAALAKAHKAIIARHARQYGEDDDAE